MISSSESSETVSGSPGLIGFGRSDGEAGCAALLLVCASVSTCEPATASIGLVLIRFGEAGCKAGCAALLLVCASVDTCEAASVDTCEPAASHLRLLWASVGFEEYGGTAGCAALLLDSAAEGNCDLAARCTDSQAGCAALLDEGDTQRLQQTGTSTTSWASENGSGFPARG